MFTPISDLIKTDKATTIRVHSSKDAKGVERFKVEVQRLPNIFEEGDIITLDVNFDEQKLRIRQAREGERNWTISQPAKSSNLKFTLTTEILRSIGIKVKNKRTEKFEPMCELGREALTLRIPPAILED